jgi:hypothetical protein
MCEIKGFDEKTSTIEVLESGNDFDKWTKGLKKTMSASESLALKCSSTLWATPKLVG